MLFNISYTNHYDLNGNEMKIYTIVFLISNV